MERQILFIILKSLSRYFWAMLQVGRQLWEFEGQEKGEAAGAISKVRS